VKKKKIQKKIQGDADEIGEDAQTKK